MKLLKRLALAVAAATTLGGAASAAEMAPAVDKSVTITFYNYNLASAGIGAEATKKLIADFMAANPKITVEGVPVPSPDMITRVQADMAAGRPPDLAQIVFRDIDFAAFSLGAQALEDIVPPAELAAHFEGMSPNGLQLGVLDGKTYGLAYTFSTPILFYNADLFRQAGLDPDKPPRTWPEVKAAALAIVEKTGKQGFNGLFFSTGSGTFTIQSVLMSNGGLAISDDRKTLKFAEPETVEALAMLRDLVKSGALPDVDPNSATEAMSSGNLGMFLTTSALQGALLAAAKDKWELRAAPMPAFGDKPTRPTNSGSALFILAQDPLKQRAAWELMKYLTSREGYTVITRDIGYLPLRPDIVDDDAYLGEWVEANPLIRPNLEQLSRLTPNRPMPGTNYRQVENTMMDAFNEAVFGDNDDVAGILADAQSRAQDLMPQ